MATRLQTAYRFDKYNYYRGEDKVMADEAGNLFLPDDDTMIAPELKEGYWSKFDKEAQEWHNELIPTSCKEVVDQGLSVVANSSEPHDRELIALFAHLVAAEKDVYQLHTEPYTLVQTIEKIPEPTAEEKERQKQEQAKAELDRQIAEIRECLASATLLGDSDWIAELQAQYKELIGA